MTAMRLRRRSVKLVRAVAGAVAAWMNATRLVALTVLQCFLLSFVFSPAIAGVIEDGREEKEFRKACEDFVLPQSAGRVTDARYFGSKEVVINIQDLHCHSEVQRNIGRILQALDGRYGLKRVYLEGAWGAPDTSWLAAIHDKTVRSEIVGTLLDEGRLTGAEYYSVESGRTDLLQGLEDRELYLSNLQRLNRMLEEQGTVDGILKSLKAEMKTLKAAYYNRRQVKLERTIEKYRAQKLSTGKYYRTLIRYADELGIDSSEYRSMKKYLEVTARERALAYRQVARELKEYIALLKDRLPYAAYAQLAQRTENFTRIENLYAELARLDAAVPADSPRFSHLNGFFEYLQLSHRLNPIALVDEENRLALEINSRLAGNRSEREIAFMSECLRQLEDYAGNKASVEEYSYVTGHLDEFAKLWKIYTDRDLIGSLEPYLKLYREYYRVNDERNRRFVSRLIGARPLPRGKQPSLRGNDDVSRVLASLAADPGEARVVVAGGFHTEGIRELLENERISYITITPNVTIDTAVSEDVYRKLAQAQAVINTQMFALHVLSEEPTHERALEAAQAVIAAVIAGKPDMKVKDISEAIYKKLHEIEGTDAGRVSFTIREEGKGYVVTIAYAGRTEEFSFDRGGRQQDAAAAEGSLLGKFRDIVDGFRKDRGEDRVSGKLASARLSSVREKKDTGTELEVWVKTRGADREEKVVLYGKKASPVNGIEDREFAKDRNIPQGVRDFLSSNANAIDDYVIDRAVFEKDSTLTMADVAGLSFGDTLVTGRPVRVLHERLAPLRLARLRELLHMAFTAKRRDGSSFVSLNDVLAGFKDEKQRKRLVRRSAGLPEVQFRLAAQAFLQEHFPGETRGLAAVAGSLMRTDGDRHAGFEPPENDGVHGKGGFMGKFDRQRIEGPIEDRPGAGVEFTVALRQTGAAQETEAVIHGRRAPPGNWSVEGFAASFRDVSADKNYVRIYDILRKYLENTRDIDDIIIEDVTFPAGSGLTIADLGGIGGVHNGKPLRALLQNVADQRIARFHELAHIAYAAGALSIGDVLGAVTDKTIREHYYDFKVKDIPGNDRDLRFHYALRAFQRQYFGEEDIRFSEKLKRFELSRGTTPPQWAKGMRTYYAFLRDSVFEKNASPDTFGTFSDIKRLADHAKKLEFTSMFLMPMGDPATLNAAKDDSPYALLSMYALDPRYIDWAAAGYAGKTPAERWKSFSESLPPAFEKMRNEEAMRQYAHVKTLRVLKYSLPGYEVKGNRDDILNALGKGREVFNKPGSEITELNEYRQVYDQVMMEQYFARKQLVDALSYAHGLGLWVGYDQPFFRTMEGVDAYFNPDIVEHFPNGDVKAAGYHLGQPDEQKWGDEAAQHGLAAYSMEGLKKQGYAPLIAPMHFYVDMGFDWLRLDALHFALGQEELLEDVQQLGREQGVLMAPEFLGNGNQKMVDEISKRLGFLPVETASGYRDWKQAADRNARWKGFFDYLIVRSREPSTWNPVHHDALVIEDEYAPLFAFENRKPGDEAERLRRKKVLYAVFGMALPNYSLMFGDEFGRHERINVPGTIHRWKHGSPYAAENGFNIEETVREINLARKAHPYLDDFGNLSGVSLEGARLHFNRHAPDGTVLEVTVDLDSGDFTATEYSLSGRTGREGSRSMVEAARGMAAMGEPWANSFYHQYLAHPERGQKAFEKAFSDTLKLLLFDQNTFLHRGAAWILSRRKFAGEVQSSVLEGWKDRSVFNATLYSGNQENVAQAVAAMYAGAGSARGKQWIAAQLIAATLAGEGNEWKNALAVFYRVFGEGANPLEILKKTDPDLYEALIEMHSRTTDAGGDNDIASQLSAAVSGLLSSDDLSVKNVMYVAPEIAPYAEVGGLGDYIKSIASRMAGLGQETYVVAPGYGAARDGIDTGITLRIPVGTEVKELRLKKATFGKVTVFFIDSDTYFEKPYPADEKQKLEEAIMLSRAPFEIAKALNLPLHVVHASSWQTALAPYYLNTVYRHDPLFRHTRSVYSILDTENWGQFPDNEQYYRLIGMDPADKRYVDNTGRLSLSKAAFMESDLIMTDERNRESLLHGGISGAAGALWDKEHQNRFAGVKDILTEVDAGRYNLLYTALFTGHQIFRVNIAPLIATLRRMNDPLMLLLSKFLVKPAARIASDPFGIIRDLDEELSLPIWLGYGEEIIGEKYPRRGGKKQPPLSFDPETIIGALQGSFWRDAGGEAHFGRATVKILREYAHVIRTDAAPLEKAQLFLSAINKLSLKEKQIVLQGLREKYRGRKAPALAYLLLLMNDQADGLKNTVDMDVDLVLSNIRTYLKKDAAGKVIVRPGLVQLLEIYAKVYEAQPDYPVEAAWPVLKAVVQLEKEEEAAVLEAVERGYKGRKRPSLIDGLFLINDSIREKWLQEQAAALVGRRVYYASPELSYWAGGLGPVMNFHGQGMKKLGADVVFVEPWYEKRRDHVDENGKPKIEDLRYSELGPTSVDIKEEYPPFTIHFDRKVVNVDGKEVTVDKEVTVKFARGVNKEGITVYLIRDVQENGGSYYTHLLYNYEKDYNPVKWEEFTAFFNIAAVEVVKKLETERQEREKENWKPAIVHTNDGQTAPFAAIAKTRYGNDPVMSKLIFAFTTHTYKNRGIVGGQKGVEILTKMMGIDHTYLPAFLRYYDNDPNNLVGDWTSLAIRLVHWAGAVSKQHRDDVAILDKLAHLVAVTNGATPAMMGRVFREKLLVRFPQTDLLRPTAEQIMLTKEDTKENFNALGIVSSIGQKVQVDKARILIGYSRRLVGEKAGRKRAFTDDNIRAMVRSRIDETGKKQEGAVIVLFGGHQGTPESEVLAQSLIRLEQEIKEAKEKDPATWSGSFYFVPAYTSDQKIALLAALDIQVQDSDRATGAAEYSEEDISANGGLEFSPPWHEGVIMDQGIPVDFTKPGKGNTIIPANDLPKAYLDAFTQAIDMWNNPGTRLDFYRYAATSMRLNRIQNSLLTAAAYLREYNKTVGRLAREDREDEEATARIAKAMRGAAGVTETILRNGRNEVHPFVFHYSGWRSAITSSGQQPETGSESAEHGGVTGFIEKKLQLERTYGTEAVIQHLDRGDYNAYLMDIFKGSAASPVMDAWLRNFKKSNAPVMQKNERFNRFIPAVIAALEVSKSAPAPAYAEKPMSKRSAPTRELRIALLKGFRAARKAMLAERTLDPVNPGNITVMAADSALPEDEAWLVQNAPALQGALIPVVADEPDTERLSIYRAAGMQAFGVVLGDTVSPGGEYLFEMEVSLPGQQVPVTVHAYAGLARANNGRSVPVIRLYKADGTAVEDAEKALLLGRGTLALLDRFARFSSAKNDVQAEQKAIAVLAAAGIKFEKGFSLPFVDLMGPAAAAVMPGMAADEFTDSPLFTDTVFVYHTGRAAATGLGRQALMLADEIFSGGEEETMAPSLAGLFAARRFGAVDRETVREDMLTVYLPALRNKKKESLARLGSSIAEAVPLSSLRTRTKMMEKRLERAGLDAAGLKIDELDPGIGKFPDAVDYLEYRLKPAGVSIMQFLPFAQPADDSPFQPLSPYAGDPLLIDWLSVEETRALLEDGEIRIDKLFVPVETADRVQRESIASREFEIAESSRRRLQGNAARTAQYQTFVRTHDAAWLKDYAAKMAAAKLLDRKPAEITPAMIENARRADAARFDAYSNVYRYLQWLFDIQIRNMVKDIQLKEGKAIFSMNIDGADVEAAAPVLRHWFSYGFDGVWLNVSNAGKLTSESVEALKLEVVRARHDAIRVLRFDGQVPDRVLAAAQKEGFIPAAALEDGFTADTAKAQGYGWIEAASPEQETRSHLAALPAGGTQENREDHYIERVRQSTLSGFPYVSFPIGTLWLDDRPLKTVDENNVEHYDYRVPRAGDIRRIHGSLTGKLVRLLPSGRVPTREEAYIEGLRMGEAYDTLSAAPENGAALPAAKIDVALADGRPAESVQAPGLHVFEALNELLQRADIAPGQYDGAYFKAAYDALAKIPGLQKAQWPDGWNYIRKLERKLQFAGTPEEKAAYNAQLFGFLRGVNEGMIAQRYVAQGGRLPETPSGRRMYRALLSLLDSEHIDALKTEGREELAVPPSRAAAAGHDLLSALDAAHRLLQEGNRQGRTTDAISSDVQALLNPYYERILADGTAPDTLTSEDRVARAWAVSELFALYTLFNKPPKPLLGEEIRNSLKLFERKGIQAITTAA